MPDPSSAVGVRRFLPPIGSTAYHVLLGCVAILILGPLGPEAALVAEAGSRRGHVVGGTLDPVAQAVLYAAADNPLIGEELFAAGAYLRVNRAHLASVQARDIMRWLVIAAAVALAVLGTVGIL